MRSAMLILKVMSIWLYLFIYIYVDDIIIACANMINMNDIKRTFCEKFDMTDMGELEFSCMRV